MLVVCTTAPALRDPPFWDANVYVNQGRYAAAHGLALDAWRHPPDVLKPPVFAALVLGAAVAAIGPSPLAMHLGVLAFALALIAATRSLVRALGGDERQALVAGALCATAPLFVGAGGPGAKRSADGGAGDVGLGGAGARAVGRVVRAGGAGGADQGERVLLVRAGARADVAARRPLARGDGAAHARVRVAGPGAGGVARRAARAHRTRGAAPQPRRARRQLHPRHDHPSARRRRAHLPRGAGGRRLARAPRPTTRATPPCGRPRPACSRCR